MLGNLAFYFPLLSLAPIEIEIVKNTARELVSSLATIK
jgi:hypothetical protein